MSKDKYNLYDTLCFDWELETDFELEETLYKALYSRDVNNYLAVKIDGDTKGKGALTLGGINKNPSASICVTAVIDFLTKRKPVRETIEQCLDVTQFLSVRTVNGGATWKDQYLGRVVRWIKKANKKGNHNKVPKSDGARPIMELEGLPDDIDYERYIEESISILDSLGVTDF